MAATFELSPRLRRGAIESISNPAPFTLGRVLRLSVLADRPIPVIAAIAEAFLAGRQDVPIYVSMDSDWLHFIFKYRFEHE